MTIITGRTKLVGVLGYPVGHSLSPQMHNAAFSSLSMDIVYVAMEVHPDKLSEALRGLQALGFRGVNLTIPHKEQAFGLVDELTEEARLMGAVNTIIFEEDRICGDNTDGRGFLRPLLAEGFHPNGKKALLLGAGGAARGVAMALAREGAQVIIANRTRTRGMELAREICLAFGDNAADTIEMIPAELARQLSDSELLVNSTSIGMLGNPEKRLPVSEEMLHPGHFVYDLVYNPLETPLLEMAKRRDCRTLSGIKMLVHQGAIAFEIWTGKQAPVDIMEEVVLSNLSASLGR